jgi:hypothetical protein
MESDERTAFMRTVSIYTTWLELPLGAFSVGLEVQQPKQSSREDFTRWQAGQDGAKAGLDGTPREANPHIGGSKEHQAWDTRWSRSFNSQQNKRATVMAKKARNGASRTTGKMAAAGEGLPSALN